MPSISMKNANLALAALLLCGTVSAKESDFAEKVYVDAVKQVARHVDLMLIVGSVNSSNSNRLRELAEKMGYKPNLMAINLRRGSSHTIGLIIPEIASFFFPSLIKAVEEATHAKGYNLLVLHSNDSLDREIENAEICANM